ncbi:MAG: TIGR04283 family arsenosugar biosynthesis glycosyltransferase [Hyphomicrobium sp.]
MISVIIPTLNAQASLAATLTSLVPAFVEGLIREVIVADGGSQDRTVALAEQAGATIVTTLPGRGVQLKAGATKARLPWLLFLHADTVLDAGWEREVSTFIDKVDTGTIKPSAACFRFALDDAGARPRTVELGVAVRTALFKLPFGDQGLLIPRTLYDDTGGFSELPIMEDVAIMQKLGRARVTRLRTRAITSAERYRSEGYFRRILRNQGCLALYLLRVPPARIARLYAPGRPSLTS